MESHVTSVNNNQGCLGIPVSEDQIDSGSESTIIPVPETTQHSLLAAAAVEPDEGDGWWLPVLGFSSKVVEDCYDATHGATRVQGCWVVSGLMTIVVVIRLSNLLSGAVIQNSFTVWLATTTLAALIAGGIPCVLCNIQDAIFENRHKLHLLSLGVAAAASTASMEACTFLNQSAQSMDHSDTAPKWEKIAYLTMAPMATSIFTPILVSSMLRVSFVWTVATIVTFAIGFSIVILVNATAPTAMMVCIILYTVLTTAMLYATESSSRQRFILQVRSSRLQGDLDLAEQAGLVQKSQTDAYRKAVSRMAHDLQTPIAAMRSGLNMISQDDDATAIAKVNKIVTLCKAANHWCELFIDDGIREMKMLDGGSQAFVPQSVFQSVRSMVEETVAVLQTGQLFANAVKFDLSISSSVPATVELDACGRRMLMNLISNACRNTEDGFIHVDVTPEPMQPELLRFTVTDTGCGIKDEHKPQLFEPFISNGGGIGLGMFMVKEQSEALGGWCGHTDNPQGKGAVFFFSIPFTAIAEKSSEPMGAMAKSGSASVHSDPVPVRQSCVRDGEPVVLLIDDSAQLLHLCAMELSLDGCNVSTAHGAEEALNLMKLNTYSVVFTDICMPHKSGIELCIEFRKWELESTTRGGGSTQAIFAVTGLKDDKIVANCMAAGMQGVVQKPLDLTKLTECLNRLTPAP